MDLRHGLYGKIPTVGDFVSRGWSPEICHRLGDTLQAMLAELLLGPQGRQRLIDAPQVMLMFRPGLLSSDGLTLVVMPSHDKVGRSFPLCAGVQWADSAMADAARWPSIAYGQALIRRLHMGLPHDSPEQLCAAIAEIGDPRRYAQTFDVLAGDETLPQLADDAALFRIEGPASRLPPSLTSLCTLLNHGSDVLGCSFERGGEVESFFACRRMADAGVLASIFDRRWEARGWLSYESGVHWADRHFIDPDDTATRPIPSNVDTVARAPDGADASGEP